MNAQMCKLDIFNGSSDNELIISGHTRNGGRKMYGGLNATGRWNGPSCWA